MKHFIEQYFKALNYDSRQFYALLNEFLHTEKSSSYTDSEIVQKWKTDVITIGEVYLEKLIIDEIEIEKTDGVLLNYDLVTNLPGKGCFVISLSTNREEICVWNAAK